ncbi:MAG TPA: hypothetical protein GXZ23_00535 [Clostridiales bacterium]|nr:hypothetical protein [Clostridiales bacterium]
MSYPVIYVPGIGQSNIELLDKKNEVVKRAWPVNFETKDIMKLVKAPLMKMLLLRRDAGFSDALEDIAEEWAFALRLDSNGKAVENLRLIKYEKSYAECEENEKNYINKMVRVDDIVDAVGAENIFYFSYNSFGNLFDAADDLDEFIAFVLNKTGAERVNLISISLGGVVTNAYLYRYGEKNLIHRVVNLVAGLDGSVVISDLLSNNLDMSNVNSVLSLIGGGSFEDIKPMLGILPAGIIDTCIEKIYDKLMDLVALKSTVMLGSVPADKYDIVAEKVFADGALPEIKKQADEFMTLHKNRDEIYRRLEENGTEIYALCGYGIEFLKILGSANKNGDGMAHVESASMGATAADINSQLDSFNEKYVSPDKSIDASTCFNPDRVWFFKNQKHGGIKFNDVALDIVGKLVSDDTFNSVNSDENYPQFNNARSAGRVKKYIEKAEEKLNGYCENSDELEKAVHDAEKFLENTIVPECGDAVVIAKLKGALGEK